MNPPTKKRSRPKKVLLGEEFISRVDRVCQRAEKVIDRIKAISPDPSKLHDLTDRLNASLRKFEDALNDLNLGLESEVELYPDGTTLIFRKGPFSERYRLIVSSAAHGTFTPLCSTSRSIRLRAVGVLQALVHKIMGARDVVKAFEDAIAEGFKS